MPKKIIFTIILVLIVLIGGIYWLAQRQTREEVDIIPVQDQDFTPKLLYELNLNEEIRSIAYSPDGTMIAVGHYQKVDLYNALSKGDLVKSFDFPHSVDNVAFSPSGKILAGGVTLGGVTLYDIDSEEKLHELHGGYDNNLAFSSDGESIATTNREGVVWIWDINTGEQINTFEPENKDVALAIALSSDNKYVAMGNMSNMVYVWNVQSGELSYDYELKGSYVQDIVISPDAKTMAVISGNREVNLFDLSDGRTIDAIETENALTKLDFSPDGAMLAVGENILGQGNLGMATTWRAADWSILERIKNPDKQSDRVVVSDLAFSNDSKKLAIGDDKNNLYLWQILPDSSQQ